MSRNPKPRRCEDCRYFYATSYEYGEYECAAGVSEDDEHFTGDGCTYHWNKLRAMAKLLIEHRQKHTPLQALEDLKNG